MSPITHFLSSWVFFERALTARRDKALVVLAGVIPDVDGLGLLLDLANDYFLRPATTYYADYHRFWTHGITSCLLFCGLASLFAKQKWRTTGGVFLSIHLHYLCDLVGARGVSQTEIWGLYYWGPWTKEGEWSWSLQWPLAGWQNTLITAVLIFIALRRSLKTGYSPLILCNKKIDWRFVQVLRLRFGS